MCNVDLWVETLDLLDFATTSYRWIEVHSQLRCQATKGLIP